MSPICKNEVDDEGDDGDGNDDEDFDDDDLYDEDGHGDVSSQEQLLMMLNHLKQTYISKCRGHLFCVDCVDFSTKTSFPQQNSKHPLAILPQTCHVFVTPEWTKTSHLAILFMASLLRCACDLHFLP